MVRSRVRRPGPARSSLVACKSIHTYRAKYCLAGRSDLTIDLHLPGNARPLGQERAGPDSADPVGTSMPGTKTGLHVRPPLYKRGGTCHVGAVECRSCLQSSIMSCVEVSVGAAWFYRWTTRMTKLSCSLARYCLDMITRGKTRGKNKRQPLLPHSPTQSEPTRG